MKTLLIDTKTHTVCRLGADGALEAAPFDIGGVVPPSAFSAEYALAVFEPEEFGRKRRQLTPCPFKVQRCPDADGDDYAVLDPDGKTMCYTSQEAALRIAASLNKTAESEVAA